MRGIAIEVRRSRNSYARSSRSVTVRPTGMPSRSLNAATDLRARRMFGCWPAIVGELLLGGLEHLGVLLGLADAHVERDL